MPPWPEPLIIEPEPCHISPAQAGSAASRLQPVLSIVIKSFRIHTLAMVHHGPHVLQLYQGRLIQRLHVYAWS